MTRKEISFRLWPTYVRLCIGIMVYPRNGRSWFQIIKAHLPVPL